MEEIFAETKRAAVRADIGGASGARTHRFRYYFKSSVSIRIRFNLDFRIRFNEEDPDPKTSKKK